MPNTGVKGRVVDAETGEGIPGLTITVVDFDPFFNEDDVLKKAVIESTDGSFQFVYAEDSYRLWSIDRNPDIVVRVSLPNGRLLFESKEVKDVTDNILEIPEIKIHKNSMEGWLVNHTTLNPANGNPVFLFKGNEIKHLVDGDKMFPAVTQAAIDATQSINLMGLFFDVNNGFISMFREEFNDSNPPPSNCKSGMEATLEEVLKNKTAMPVNVMMTNMPLSAEDTVTEVKEFFQNTIVKTAYFKKGFCLLHSKAIILDGVKAILMGSPLKQYYYSDIRHAIHDARHKGSLNHDVSIQIEGPAVAQINKTFATVWKSTKEPLTMLTQDDIPEKSGDENSSIASVQVLRTLPAANYNSSLPGDEDAPHGETGILEAYQRAINNAERFIYIENQYFTSPDIIDALIFRMKDSSKSKLEIIIVVPVKPDLPGYPDRHVDNINQLKNVAKANGHKLAAYTMWSRSEIVGSGGNKEFQIMPVYVHSKMAIIDDTWATVGSANLDGTSMNHHEIDLLVSGALMDRVIAKFKPGDDIGKFLWDAFWYIFFFIFKELFFSLKTLLAILFIAYKFIFDFKKTMELIRETLEDITDIPGIIREVFTRTAQHVLPNREHQPGRNLEMNIVMYNGIAGQPKNGAIKLLRQRLWEEHLGLLFLPDNILNLPETGDLNWISFWEAQANKNKEAIKNNQSLPTDDAPVILPWKPETEAKEYLKSLEIRTKNLRDKADVFLFDKCKFDDNKKFIPWPIV
jgi:phosphatidylserine/phosphatidylglycerophosphate/cardiolipin synthase-like enzyme